MAKLKNMNKFLYELATIVLFTLVPLTFLIYIPFGLISIALSLISKESFLDLLGVLGLGLCLYILTYAICFRDSFDKYLFKLALRALVYEEQDLTDSVLDLSDELLYEKALYSYLKDLEVWLLPDDLKQKVFQLYDKLLSTPEDEKDLFWSNVVDPFLKELEEVRDEIQQEKNLKYKKFGECFLKQIKGSEVTHV